MPCKAGGKNGRSLIRILRVVQDWVKNYTCMCTSTNTLIAGCAHDMTVSQSVFR